MIDVVRQHANISHSTGSFQSAADKICRPTSVFCPMKCLQVLLQDRNDVRRMESYISREVCLEARLAVNAGS
jgi:hypothetical protein